MDKVFVAKRVAEKLWSTEAKIDQAMREAAELMTEVLKAPLDAGVSPTLVDASQAKIMEGLKALSEARTAVVQAHAHLNEAKLRAGVRTKLSFSADGFCPVAERREGEAEMSFSADGFCPVMSTVESTDVQTERRLG